ncbi:MAG: cobaltochelatase CobT [Arenicella sp.]|jgi:cobaltochelatase CobT
MEHQQRHEVLQQKLENWCAASIRALSGDTSVHFRGHHLVVNNKPLRLQAPYLQLDFSTVEASKIRGIADSIALRLLHSNLDQHQARMPESIVEKIIYEQLEQLRCASLSPEMLPGMRSNLRSRFLFWANQVAASSLTESSIGLLLYSINVVCWSRLQAQAIPVQIEELIEATRLGFNAQIKHHLYQLNKCRDDQDQFALHALAIAKEVMNMIEDSQGEKSDESSVVSTVRQAAKSNNISIQWLDLDSISIAKNYDVSRTEDIRQIEAGSDYQIYSKAYDKVIKIGKSIRAAELAKLRAQLDKRLRKQSVNTHRVARYLKQLISSPDRAGWEFGLEEGYLDSARLASLITSPSDRRIFKKEQIRAASDCIVSIVVDNSGSMNNHNDVVAAMIDTLAKALELAEIRTEILGFTTTEWNGGRVVKDWTRAGKPENPGRLTSTCHNIYKAAETPWRRSRLAIAAMLKTDLFREGVDGEALEWAVERIETRPEKNKIIIMVSDGSPMDTATHAANSGRSSPNYLDQHLTYVANGVQRRPDIQLCALGVGLDLSAYYRESMAINLSDELATRDFMLIADLLARAC